MAKYNREFLVPYLNNICALHLKGKQYQQKIENLRYELQHCDKKPDVWIPVCPDKPTITMGRVILVGLGLFWFLGGIAMMTFGIQEGLGILIYFAAPIWLLLGGILLLIAIIKICRERKEYKEDMEGYRRTVDEHRRRVQEMENQNEQTRAYIRREIQEYVNEREKTDGVLEKMYGVNIIPMRYRELYAAVYLYDWFSNGGSDDMDMALNTYVLETIKDKLDVVIRNQSQSIINQQHIIANQYKSIEQQRAYQNSMRAKMDQLQLTGEEGLKYAKMIESNTAALAYFAERDFRKDF